MMKFKVGDKVRFVNKYELYVGRFLYEWDKGLETKIYAIKNNKARIDGGFEIPLECFALIEEKQAHEKHNILNGLTNKDDALTEKFEYQNDLVNHPSHYTDGKIEVIDFIEDKKLGYHLGNACKYISRCQLKNDGRDKVQDLRKAIWYIERQIYLWEKEEG